MYARFVVTFFCETAAALPQFFLFPFQKCLEILMELPERLDRLFSGLGHPRAAAAFSSCGDFHKGLFCLPVHGIHQVPGMAIGHVH